MKIYISGPMTGLPEFNIPAFKAAAEILRAKGYDVVCPHELITYAPELTWKDYLKADLIGLLACDTLVQLPGWAESKGAMLEYQVARALEFKVFGFYEGELVL